MNAGLGQFQNDFVAALLDHQAAAALARQPGYAVYRNTVFKAGIEALETNFPSVRGALGAAEFARAAADFVRTRPPDDPRLARYGAGFSGYLRAADAAHCVDLARLDRAWTEAHLSTDAAPLDPAELATLAARELATLQVCAHPATRCLIAAPSAITAWLSARGDGDGRAHDGTQPAALLMTRPAQGVRWRSVDRALAALIDAVAEPIALATALAAVMAKAPRCDPGAVFSVALGQGALIPAATGPSR